jgi:hypothetical protein
MNNILSLKKCIQYSVFIVAVFFAGFAHSQGNPATNPICADLTGQVSSICIRAVAAGCTEDASSLTCQTLEEQFTELTGEEPYWICPCFTSSEIDENYSEIIETRKIIAFVCFDTSWDDVDIYTDISPVTFWCSTGGWSSVRLAEVWWQEGGAHDERYCNGYDVGDLNDLNFSQAQACRQAILGSTTWQDSGCPDRSILP